MVNKCHETGAFPADQFFRVPKVNARQFRFMLISLSTGEKIHAERTNDGESFKDRT